MNGPGTRSAPAPGVHPAQQHRAEHHVITARPAPPAPAPRPGGTSSPATSPAPGPAPAPARPAPHPPAGRTRWTAVPSPRASSSPNGAVGSVTSPSSPAKYRSCSSARHPQPGLRHEVPERQRLRQPVALPGQQRRDLPQHHLHARRGPAPGDASAAAPATGPCPARPPRTAAAAAPGPGPSAPRPPPAAAATAPPGRRPRVAGRPRSPAARACRHTTCTGSGSPSQATDVRRMSCRAITCSSAADERLQPAPRLTPQHQRLQVHVRGRHRPAIRWWKNMPSCSGASG